MAFILQSHSKPIGPPLQDIGPFSIRGDKAAVSLQMDYLIGVTKVMIPAASMIYLIGEGIH